MPPPPDPAPDHDPRVQAALAGWRRELAALGGPDTLLTPSSPETGVLDLSSAHPSGLATFLAGRPTRLSSLFREPGALAVARRGAVAVRRTAARLTDEHGLPGSHLALGLLTLPVTVDRAAVAAPVLVAPVAVEAGERGDADPDVQLRGAARVNPSLLRVLGHLGVAVAATDLLGPADASTGVTARPAMRRLRDLTSGLPQVQVSDRTVIGTFVDLGAALVAAFDDAAPDLGTHPLVAALAAAAEPGDPPAGRRPPRGTPWPRQRDDLPTALPLDPRQAAALDAVRTGADVTVLARAGTGATQLAAQVVAAAAEADRTVLVLAPRRPELDDLRARMAAAGLGALADSGVGATGPGETGSGGTVPGRGEPGETGPGGTDAAGLAVAVRTAHDLRVQLVAARRALHERREPWGTSKLDVLRTLRADAGGPAVNAPALLPLPALARLAGERRAQAAALLTEAVALGAGTPEASRTPWAGAAVDSADTAAAALGAVRRLLEGSLAAAQAELARVCAAAGLADADTAAGWGRLLRLLADVRASQQLFVPAVYEGDIEAMVAATASPQWRARNGVPMPLIRRRAVRGQVRELLRPGGRADDLHAALLRVRSELATWRRLSTGGGWPRVPAGLEAADAAYRRVRGDLDLLEPALATSTVGAELADLPLAELHERLRTLERDAPSLQQLPRRTAVMATLTRLGLLDVLAHLRAVPHRPQSLPEVSAELEELWARAVLDAADAQDQGLSTDPGPARDAERQVRRIRAARLAERERERSTPTAALLTALALPHRLPPDRRFDVVLLLDAGALGVAEAVPAVARSGQVVVVGDPDGPRPAPAAPEAGAGASPAGRRADVLGGVRAALPEVALGRRHGTSRDLLALTGPPPAWGVPSPDPSAALRLAVVGASGRGSDGAADVDAEVVRVVQVVLEHARTRPNESLAVVAVDRAHARDVARAVRAELAKSPDLAPWFADPRRPAFLVTDLEGADAAAREHVVLTVGVARAPHRRAADLGRLDGPDGDRLLRRAVTRASRRLTVVTCLDAAAFGEAHEPSPGALALHALLTHLGRPAEVAVAADPPDGSGAPLDPVQLDPVLLDPVLLDPVLLDPVLRRLVAAVVERGAAATVPVGDAACTPDLTVAADGARTAVLWDGRPPVAVDAGVLRDEEELEAALLRAGWRVARVAARDVVADAGAVADAVLAAGAVGQPSALP